MTQDLKHIIVYGAFGLLLGTKIVEVLFTRTDTGLMDWWLLLIGVGAAVVHYLPLKEKTPPDDQRPASSAAPREDEDTLVLRDHPDAERGPLHRRDPATADRGTADFLL